MILCRLNVVVPRPQGPGNQQTAPRAGVPSGILLANTELLDDRTVSLNVVLHEVVEQAATLAYQLQQTAPGGVVVLVFAEVLRKVVDAGRENGNLHFGRPGIIWPVAMLFDEFLRLLFRNHAAVSS